PQVSLIANDRNRGYGAAANQGLAACSAPYVLLLNADAVPEPGAPAALAAYLDRNSSVGIVGPRLVDPDCRLQPSSYPFLTPANVLLVMSGLNGVIARIPLLAVRHLPTSPHDAARRVPWVKGAALAVRTESFHAVGGFDESFFLYGEEHDLCYRLGRAGWETHFAPVATVVHVERASSRGREVEITEQIYSSLFRFYRHHYSRTRQIELRIVLGVVMAARIVRDALFLSWARDARRRMELRDNIGVWRRILIGRVSDAAVVVGA